MTVNEPRKHLDQRPLSEQYQFTQADTLISREHQKEASRRKFTKRKHWATSISFMVGVALLIYWLTY